MTVELNPNHAAYPSNKKTMASAAFAAMFISNLSEVFGEFVNLDFLHVLRIVR